MQLKQRIAKLKEFDDEYIVYAGHGDDTNMGYEKRNTKRNIE